jgi:hypothetical protein
VTPLNGANCISSHIYFPRLRPQQRQEGGQEDSLSSLRQDVQQQLLSHHPHGVHAFGREAVPVRVLRHEVCLEEMLRETHQFRTLAAEELQVRNVWNNVC